MNVYVVRWEMDLGNEMAQVVSYVVANSDGDIERVLRDRLPMTRGMPFRVMRTIPMDAPVWSMRWGPMGGPRRTSVVQAADEEGARSALAATVAEAGADMEGVGRIDVVCRLDPTREGVY